MIPAHSGGRMEGIARGIKDREIRGGNILTNFSSLTPLGTLTPLVAGKMTLQIKSENNPFTKFAMFYMVCIFYKVPLLFNF